MQRRVGPPLLQPFYDVSKLLRKKPTAVATGLVGNDTLIYSLSREAGENAGDYIISVTLGENANYSVTVENGIYTIEMLFWL